MEEHNSILEGTLVFVWNADQGWQHAIYDSLHKWISPASYQCKLCQLTYGFTSPRPEWRSFLDALDRPVFFYHRDEFRAAGIKGAFSEKFPLILERRNSKWEVLMDSIELDQLNNLEELLGRLKQELLPNIG